MPQRHKHADVIIAWANGAEIEFKVEATGEWVRARHPGWHEDCEYRVKPPKNKYRVGLFKIGENKPFTVVAETDVMVMDCETDIRFVRWFTDWIEYEE